MKTIQEFVSRIRESAEYLSGSISDLRNKRAKITVHEINRTVIGPTVDDLAQDFMIENQSGMAEVEFSNVLTVTIGRNVYKIDIITTAFYWITVEHCPGDNFTPGATNYSEHLQKEVFTDMIEDVTPNKMKNEIQDNRQGKPEPVAEKKDFQQPPAAIKKAVQKPLKLNNLDDVYSFAKKLRKYITDNNLSVNIQGREYAYVDGWKFALVSFGLVPIVSKPERVDGGKVAYIFSRWQEFTKKGVKDRKLVPYFAGTNEQIAEIQRKKFPPDHEHVAEYFAYRCDCDLKNMATGEIVGTGTALCTNIESKKTGFDEYAVLSMAQTRAIGKAARNLIGFVMNHAGLESTPAEEMEPLVDPMMPPTGNQDGPENSGDPYADIKIAVSDCKTLQELTDLWDKNPENHKDKIFQQVFSAQKIKITTPQK